MEGAKDSVITIFVSPVHRTKAESPRVVTDDGNTNGNSMLGQDANASKVITFKFSGKLIDFKF
jgi:hypothetical protein